MVKTTGKKPAQFKGRGIPSSPPTQISLSVSNKYALLWNCIKLTPIFNKNILLFIFKFSMFAIKILTVL